MVSYSVYRYREKIVVSGVSIFSKQSFWYTGGKMDFIWEEAGISLHFPDASYKEEIEISVSVATNADHLGILPPKYRLMPAASATYRITASNVLPAPAQIRIQHCAILHKENSLILMVARNRPPYWFEPLNDGEFPLKSDYCEISTKKFSLFHIVWNLLFNRPMRLSVRIFYHNDNTATFVVTKNLPTHIAAVKQTIAHTRVEDIPISCESTTESIVLSLPKMSEGWRVTSHFEPAEIKTLDINTYVPVPGISCPKIILCMEWKGSGIPKEERVSIPITGGSFSSFYLQCKPKQHENEPVRIQSEPLVEIPRLYNSPHFSYQPTLPRLQTLTTAFGSVRIIERIGVKNHDLGICLLNDYTGAITSNIEAQYAPDQNRITKAILQRWLEGTGRTPQSWATLLTVLREIELKSLAEETAALLMHSVFPETQVKQSRDFIMTRKQHVFFVLTVQCKSANEKRCWNDIIRGKCQKKVAAC